MARVASRQRVQRLVDSRLGRITINYLVACFCSGFLGLGETSRFHSVGLARVSRPLRRFTSGLPKISFLPRPEDPLVIIGHILGHHVPRRFGQFAGQRFGGDDRVGLLLLPVVEAPALVVVAAGKVRGFHKGPGQVGVPAFAVVLAFLFAVARAQAFHAATIAGEVSRVGEAFGVARLKGDGQSQDLSDAGQFLEALIGAPLPGDVQHVGFDLMDGLGQMAHEFDLGAAQELIRRIGEQRAGFFGLHGLDAGQGDPLAEGALVETFEAQDQTGALMHQQQAAAQQIAHGPRLAVVEMAGGQNVQAQEFGEEEGVGNIVGVFEAVVGFHARGVGQHNIVAVIPQAVGQPIPVVSGLDGDGGDALLVGIQQLQDGRQVAGELLVDEALAAFVHQPAEGVVAVQVNASHNLHGGSPVVEVLV